MMTCSAALVLALFCGFTCRLAAADLPWQLDKWEYRQVFEIVPVNSATRMNTGLIELVLPRDVPLDAAALRILDEKGRNVPFQCLDERGERLDSVIPVNGVIRLHFHVADPDIRRYLVYFGNPSEETVFGPWEKELTALVLETRENPKSTNARSWDAMVRLIANSRKRYGKGDRRQINDSANPYGPDEQFLSVYRGLIYCPEEGVYDFGTDSDDASFLLIDGAMAVKWPGGHSESGQFDHFGRIELTAGAHRIEYYHVQSGGGTLARAGWRPPGARSIEIIPETAFVREYRTEPLWIERRDDPCSAFFRNRIDDSFRFGLDGPGFVNVRFENRSRSSSAAIAVNEWHFGDGDVSLDVEPQHLFRAGQSYDVTLRVTDELGFESVFSKTLPLTGPGERRIDVWIELDAQEAIIAREDPLSVTVRCGDSAGEAMPFLLTAHMKGLGEVLLSESEPVELPEKGWLSRDKEILRAAAGRDIDEADFGLSYKGAPVASAALRVIDAGDPWDDLAFTHGAITDPSGSRVIIRLSDSAGTGAMPEFIAKLNSGTGRIVVLDDILSGQDEEGYPELLVKKLGEAFPDAKVELRRTQFMGEGGSLSILRRLPAVLEEIGDPDLIVLSASMRNVLHFMPVNVFENELQAIVEKLSTRTNAAVVLVAPPPTLTNPGLSQAYAIAVKRVGLRLGVPVADAHSAFLKAAGADPLGWREFYRDTRGGAPVYTVAPGAEGQELIAGLIERTILDEGGHLKRGAWK
jgi:lysophospholipase L1-like esterase